MAVLLSYALCTVADVKELLGIDSGDSTKNNLIIRKINQATEMIENYCQRRFALSTYTEEVYDGSGTGQLLLRNRPIVSLTYLGVRGNSLNENDFNEIDTNQYFVDNNAGIVESPGGAFYGGYDRWRVSYTAGYSTIPADIAEACATLAAYLVDNPTGAGGGTGIKKQTEGQRSIEYFDNSGSAKSLIESLGLDDILAPYTETIISGQR